jgi:hypothetical protein
MTPQPLPKAIYDKAKQLEVTSIRLEFSGGNDEGNLYVSISSITGGSSELNALETEVETWAYDAYPYNGAGDGTDYGDDIVYDLENNKVTTSEWHMERQDSDPNESEMEVD